MSAMHPLWPFFVPPHEQDDPQIRLESAHGVRVRLTDGSTLLDGTSGLWNTNLGYGNAAIARACAEALQTASYLSTFRFESVHARRAAQALVDVTGDVYARVLFSTSGSAANDLVMKLARHYQVLGGQPRRQLVVGLRDSYHGLTYGSFSLTGEDLGQALYGVDRRLVRHTAPNDLDELSTLLAHQGHLVAAVVVEPMLGTGAVPLTDEFVRALLAARDEHGFLLVADEVATGFGRTGSLFASDRWPARPDVLLTSKALTNGTSATSAVLVSEDVARRFHDSGAVFVHGETQAGSPVAAAAVVATLEEMERLDAVALGHQVSAGLDVGIAALQRSDQRVTETRGVGCFRAVDVLGDDGEPLDPHAVGALVRAVRRAGAIVHPGVGGIQVVPALTSTPADVAELFDRVSEGLAELTASSALTVATTPP